MSPRCITEWESRRSFSSIACLLAHSSKDCLNGGRLCKMRNELSRWCDHVPKNSGLIVPELDSREAQLGDTSLDMYRQLSSSGLTHQLMHQTPSLQDLTFRFSNTLGCCSKTTRCRSGEKRIRWQRSFRGSRRIILRPLSLQLTR